MLCSQSWILLSASVVSYYNLVFRTLCPIRCSKKCATLVSLSPLCVSVWFMCFVWNALWVWFFFTFQVSNFNPVPPNDDRQAQAVSSVSVRLFFCAYFQVLYWMAADGKPEIKKSTNWPHHFTKTVLFAGPSRRCIWSLPMGSQRSKRSRSCPRCSRTSWTSVWRWTWRRGRALPSCSR